MDFKLDIIGTAPLLMHSARLSDPLDPASRAIRAASKNKTEEGQMEMARLEHQGGLYIAAPDGPYIPGQNLEAALFRGASKVRLMSTLKAALLIPEEINPLIYRGPRDAAGLWEAGEFVHRASVKVGQARVMRTRPIFHQWQVSATGMLEVDQVDQDAFERVVEIAGRMIGLGDWRPRFGRFTATVTWL